MKSTIRIFGLLLAIAKPLSLMAYEANSVVSDRTFDFGRVSVGGNVGLLNYGLELGFGLGPHIDVIYSYNAQSYIVGGWTQQSIGCKIRSPRFWGGFQAYVQAGFGEADIHEMEESGLSRGYVSFIGLEKVLPYFANKDYYVGFVVAGYGHFKIVKPHQKPYYDDGEEVRPWMVKGDTRDIVFLPAIKGGILF